MTKEWAKSPLTVLFSKKGQMAGKTRSGAGKGWATPATGWSVSEGLGPLWRAQSGCSGRITATPTLSQRSRPSNYRSPRAWLC